MSSGSCPSTSLTGSLQAALWAFVCAYLLLLGLTWAVYLRRGSSVAAHRI